MQYKVFYKVCPHCSNRLGHGYRRFGPAQVECYFCGETAQSGLTPWADLSGRDKIVLAVTEIVAPSYGPAWATLLLTVILFYFMPIINAIYLISIVRESNRYSQTGVLPTWKG
jgi:hypothetical protein